ncbi:MULTISPECIES: Ig-like domain-containing protein [Flavobacterium]|jgi:hypothetical protein|uniref:Big-1 domain-containing protein n=1 Tax=Flavobacterium tructae TaxID=1114873 RepID=A0A1S1JD83_9FLAO|nr:MULTISPECIES: Ig-like domain-containing protein [Flavobacterium]OHT47076.1 hypothetical protein BHE19_21835 [Flavobacterium tructae]OXB15737.1 hypothetical protein B0A71_20155 [Flavobacterium tructae]
MKYKISIFSFCLFTILLVSVTLMPKKQTGTIVLITQQKTFIAGDKIILDFKGNSSNKPKLFLIHSLGKTLLDGTIKNDKLTFILPRIYAEKAGHIDWFLAVNGENKLHGNFEILPNNGTKTNIENYLGPPSTLVGDDHFVMYVTIPTDDFDNPKPENTLVIFRSQFLNAITTQTVKTKDLIAWKIIKAPTKSGIVLVSAQCNATITKEFDAVIFAGIATNFMISFIRNHQFADGNQITTLKTTIIKDKFGNVVSDGTMVSFIISTTGGMVLKSFGTTINGIATAQILHPDHQDVYTVKAYVAGIAESNSIAINYMPINPKIEFGFSKDNRTIIVGPLRSFMNQLVPDGIKVSLKVYHHNQLIATLQEDSEKGYAVFTISSEYYKEKKYSFEISTLGSSEKVEEKKYDSN